MQDFQLRVSAVLLALAWGSGFPLWGLGFGAVPGSHSRQHSGYMKP